MPKAAGPIRAVLWDACAILVGETTCFVYNFEAKTWHEREALKVDVAYFGLVVDSDMLYVAGGGTCSVGEDKEEIWICTDKVRSVPVRDVIEDKRGARWTHHATLPQRATVYAFSPVPLYRPRSTNHQ